MSNIVGETSEPNIAAVKGASTAPVAEAGPGVIGTSEGTGVWGQSSHWQGVVGQALAPDGGNGVWGEAFGGGCGVYGTTKTGAAAIRGEHTGGGLAADFIGKVSINGECGVQHHLKVNGSIFTLGDVQLIGAGQDLAEPFAVEGDQSVQPGSVVVLLGPDRVRLSDIPYDPRVAGVVSGAGDLRPGIVLGRDGAGDERPAIALTGKVWCFADAEEDPIRVGDLLTSSRTPGHAMRASDPARSFGAVIGKALSGLRAGRALIPVLVALR